MKSQEHKPFISYLISVIRFSPSRFFAGCSLMLASAVCSGAGLLMLIPILHYSGWLPSEATQSSAHWLSFVVPKTGQWPLPLTLFVFVVVICSAGTLEYLCKKYTNRLRVAFTFHLQQRLNASIARAKWSYTLTRKLHDANHLMSTGVQQAVMLNHVCFQMLSEAVLVGAYLLFACALSLPLTLITGALALIPFFIARHAGNFQNGINQFLTSRKTHEQLLQFLDGIKVAQSYNLVEGYVSRFDGLLQKSADQQMSYVQREGKNRLASQVGAAVIFSIVFFVAVKRLEVNAITLVAMLVVLSRLVPRVQNLQQSYLKVINLVPVFTQLTDMIEEFEAHRESLSTGASPLPTTHSIRFENVHYAYHDRPILTDLSCQIPFHQTTAITGPSGAGKTTFADLLLGLLTPTAGKIYLDGSPLDTTNAARWRDSISYVPQEPYLFNDTIRANLQWAAPLATEEEMWKTLAAVSAEVFVRRLPLGLDTPIGDKGTHFSGGERQRLALARALLRKPQVLLLDEATSAVDRENEEFIHEALRALSGKLTIILIAHRLSTIRAADQVFVLKDGKLIEAGTPDALATKPQSVFTSLFGDFAPAT